MENRRIKYIVGLTIIIAAFLYLAWTSFRASFQFALTPSEFLASKAEYLNRTVKISGQVEEGSISVNGLDYLFKIADNEKTVLSVHYRGIVPNTFREGAEVVVSGRFDPVAGNFEATQMLTKCASKYISR